MTEKDGLDGFFEALQVLLDRGVLDASRSPREAELLACLTSEANRWVVDPFRRGCQLEVIVDATYTRAYLSALPGNAWATRGVRRAIANTRLGRLSSKGWVEPMWHAFLIHLIRTFFGGSLLDESGRPIRVHSYTTARDQAVGSPSLDPEDCFGSIMARVKEHSEGLPVESMSAWQRLAHHWAGLPVDEPESSRDGDMFNSQVGFLRCCLQAFRSLGLFEIVGSASDRVGPDTRLGPSQRLRDTYSPLLGCSSYVNAIADLADAASADAEGPSR